MFFFRSGASLKVTYSPLQKRLPFCRSIYVKKVIKLLAFIFEQPSYVHLAKNSAPANLGLSLGAHITSGFVRRLEYCSVHLSV